MLPSSSKTEARSPARLDLESFRLIWERNIFNPNRTGRYSRTQQYTRRREPDRRAPVESFALMGTMSYEKGNFAFFEGSSSQYQKVLEKYPRFIDSDKVLARQYEIANRFLAGQWFRLWTYIPFFPSMDKTADMYGKIVKDGPFSTIAPQAQMKIGEAREKQKNFPEAAKAYEVAADRYHDRPPFAADGS